MSLISLWPKQQPALEFALARDEVALLCEQRTGKTYITIALLERLMKSDELEGGSFCGVLICLLNNKDSTWMVGLDNLLPGMAYFTDLAGFKAHKGHKLLLVHFEQLRSVIDKLARYKALNWAGIDEAHRIASRGSQQSRAAARLSRIRRKLILTGTPLEKRPTDVYAQFRFLSPEVLGTNWADFENEWLEFDEIDISHIPRGTRAWQDKVLKNRILRSKATFRWEKLPKFMKLVKPLSYRITKEDVGIKPPKIIKVSVPIHGQQRRCYDEMAQDQVTTLPSGKSIMAGLRVTTIMKERQLASGFIYDEDKELTYIGGAKKRRCIKLFKQLNKPVVIFTAFKPDTDQIYEALVDQGYDMARVYGGTKKELRPAIWKGFQAGQYDGLVCQIKTGGVGVDLWKANSAIVHSMGHSFIDWDQAKARLDSKEKKKPSDIYVLCGENTIDEPLFELVLVKHLNGAKVLNQLKRNIPHGQKSRKKRSRRKA